MIEDGVKISELTEISVTNDSDLIPIVQSDETKQISKLQLTRNINSYSGAETICGGWIDGKPIYRKVIYIGQLPNNTSKTVAHNINNINKILKCTGYAYAPTSGSFVSIPYSSGSTNAIEIVANTTNIVVYTHIDQSAFSECYMTIEYTKTTD